ncbi:MAG: NADH-quinone oxidoreductase subunit H [Alphaproteobacteria bacterium]|nr:NADH-quinone oxidoreductase subunit H [Alphaproteobacteria bacterium]
MEILLFIIKTFVFYITVITISAYLSLLERKLIGRIQLRRGPSYCGKYGLLQPLADGLKLFFKYSCLQFHSIYSIFGVSLLLFCSLLQFAFVPITQNFYLLSSNYSLIYLIIINEMISFSEVLIGVSSKSKFGIIGGIRAIFQKFAYDIPYILIVIYISVLNNTLNINKINVSIVSPEFNVLLFLVSIIFFVINLIKINHIPFDCVEAESELVAGAYTEYGGMLFGMIYLSDYLNVLFGAVLYTKFFLGVNNIILFTICDILFIASIIIIRTLFPRFLQQQIIKLSYRYLIPICCLFLLYFINLY